jgi:hypothetical protein
MQNVSLKVLPKLENLRNSWKNLISIEKSKRCAIVHCCVMLIQVCEHLLIKLENRKDVLGLDLCDVNSSFSTLKLENLHRPYTHTYGLQL